MLGGIEYVYARRHNIRTLGVETTKMSMIKVRIWNLIFLRQLALTNVQLAEVPYLTNNLVRTVGANAQTTGLCVKYLNQLEARMCD